MSGRSNTPGRGRVAWARALACLGAWCALACVLASCSLQTLERQRCSEATQCRAAFGLASVCQPDGYCSNPVVHPRCTKTFPDDLLEAGGAHADTIVFGSLFNRESSTHEARERSIQLAIRQINDEGGFQGRDFGVVFCNIAPMDSDGVQSTADGALAGAEYLVSVLDVPAILGPASSGDVGKVFEAVRESGVFIISPSATGPGLTDIDNTEPTDEDPGLLWRTAPPDSLQGRAIASDMEARGVTTVRIIAEADAYGEELSAIFQASFSGTSELVLFDKRNDLTEAITEAGNSNAQEVLFIASAQRDVVEFLDGAATIKGYEDKMIFLTDSAATSDTLAASASLFPRIRGTRPTQLTTDDPVFGNFTAAFQAEFDQNVTVFGFAAQSYDMTWVTLLGTAWALLQEDGLTGRNIARGARKLSAGEQFNLTPSRWERLVEALGRGEGVDIRGASGDLDYRPDEEEIRATIDIWVIETEDDVPAIVVDQVFSDS